MVGYGLIHCGMVWYGIVWYTMVCYAMAWYAMVWCSHCMRSQYDTSAHITYHTLLDGSQPALFSTALLTHWKLHLHHSHQTLNTSSLYLPCNPLCAVGFLWMPLVWAGIEKIYYASLCTPTLHTIQAIVRPGPYKSLCRAATVQCINSKHNIPE